MKFKIHLFTHSLISDWNHGNAHFLRGLARDLGKLGHEVRCHEELGSWSLTNLVQYERERSIQAIDQFRDAFGDLKIFFYKNDSSLADHLQRELHDADIVIVHEWNDPNVVNSILDLKQQFGFRALFHDTHHRAYSRPGELLRFHMHLFDGVLAFGEALRKIYAEGFGMSHAWTFHEAADIEKFHPIEAEKRADVLWIGNWGDDERSRELQEFLIKPATESPKRRVVVHGVRYPEEALNSLNEAGIVYCGYLPNLDAPRAYAESAVALHLPRNQYSNGLSGIPTIRVFESLACGAPLLCSPWNDAEGLFRPGEDFICVPSGKAMKSELEFLLRDDAARKQIGANGLQTVRSRHTSMHRAEQLTEIIEEIAA
jgi:spore maturation protein CgeB